MSTDGLKLTEVCRSADLVPSLRIGHALGIGLRDADQRVAAKDKLLRQIICPRQREQDLGHLVWIARLVSRVILGEAHDLADRRLVLGQ